jgi:hypothetical protein
LFICTHFHFFLQVEEWEIEETNYEMYEREDVEWDSQYSSGRKRSGREGVAIDVDLLTRKLRKPRYESQEEVTRRMLSVEAAVRDSLLAKGEAHFTDLEFPPNDRSLFVDPANPPLKLQVHHLVMWFILRCRKMNIDGAII